MPEYSELTRRLGIEYNGMILHKYLFENMLSAGVGEPGKNSFFFEAAERSFGSYDTWRTDFVGMGEMRGAGWAICCG
jgi:Fe-Mn family superoxide dismutase